MRKICLFLLVFMGNVFGSITFVDAPIRSCNSEVECKFKVNFSFDQLTKMNTKKVDFWMEKRNQKTGATVKDYFSYDGNSTTEFLSTFSEKLSTKTTLSILPGQYVMISLNIKFEGRKDFHQKYYFSNTLFDFKGYKYKKSDGQLIGFLSFSDGEKGRYDFFKSEKLTHKIGEIGSKKVKELPSECSEYEYYVVSGGKKLSTFSDYRGRYCNSSFAAVFEVAKSWFKIKVDGNYRYVKRDVYKTFYSDLFSVLSLKGVWKLKGKGKLFSEPIGKDSKEFVIGSFFKFSDYIIKDGEIYLKLYISTDDACGDLDKEEVLKDQERILKYKWIKYEPGKFNWYSMC